MRFFLFLFLCMLSKENEAQKSTVKYKPAIFTSLFDGKTLKGWTAVPANGWTVTDGAIAMTGDARGFIYYNEQVSDYRIIFSVRQIKGIDHWPCQLVFGYDPSLDAMGAVQFQLPKGWTWDYRPGKNNAGNAYFSFPGPVPDVNKNDWAQCEILVHASKGSARTAVSQPIGSPAVTATIFKDGNIPDRGGFFGFQSHNKGQFDEYKDIRIEVNPQVDELLTILIPPSDLHVVQKAAASRQLTWIDNSKVEDGFLIERSIDKIQWTRIAKVKADITGYRDRKVEGKKKYYYRVAAYNAVVISSYATLSE